MTQEKHTKGDKNVGWCLDAARERIRMDAASIVPLWCVVCERDVLRVRVRVRVLHGDNVATARGRGGDARRGRRGGRATARRSAGACSLPLPPAPSSSSSSSSSSSWSTLISTACDGDGRVRFGRGVERDGQEVVVVVAEQSQCWGPGRVLRCLRWR